MKEIRIETVQEAMMLLLDHMVEEELASDERLRGISFARNLDEIREVLEG